MRSKFKSHKTLLLAVVFLITTIFSSLGSVASADEMTSDFAQLNSAQIVSAMGAGWNLGNQLEAVASDGIPNEMAWGNPAVTQALIQKVKAAGFKTIRIPVSYLNSIGSAPDYTINSAWLARVKQVVDYAYNEGLYVIINIHGDGYHTVPSAWLFVDSNDQATIRAKYQKVWQQIANTFINYNEHLIFESMNEVFDGHYDRDPSTEYYSNLNAYNQIFVDTVRQAGGNNAARWLLIPGWNTSIDYIVGNYGFALPTDKYRSSAIPSSEKRIMISAHYYSPWDFCGDDHDSITQWGATATDITKKSTWGQEDYLDSQFKLLYDSFAVQGYPVVVGEFGSIDRTAADPTNNTYRAAFAKAVSGAAKKYNSVPIVWDEGSTINHGFGLFNRSTYAVTQQGIIDAIMSGVDNYYKIINRNSGKSLDVSGSSSSDGATVVQMTYNDSYSQQWELVDIGGGYYEIINRNSGKPLEISGWSTAAGTAAGQWTYGGMYSYNQQWQLIDAGNGYFKLKNRNSGMLLDINGGYTGDWGAAVQWSDNGGYNQQWQLVQD